MPILKLILHETTATLLRGPSVGADVETEDRSLQEGSTAQGVGEVIRASRQMHELVQVVWS